MRWLPLVAMLILGGCATQAPPDVTTHYDDFSGLRTDLLSDNLLATGEQNPRELVWLNASRVFQSTSRYEYFLEVSYMARKEVGLLEIEPGQSLTLVVDDETLRMSSTGSGNAQKEAQEGLVQETCIYRVNKLTLQKLSIAQKVKVSVKGKNGLVEREFKEENFDKFRRFVTRYAL